MINGTPTSKLRHVWESAAPGWAKWEHVLSAGLSSATDALLEMAGIQPGMRVLDLACGAGNQTIQAAKRVGPSGTVVASDISTTMLEHVRQNAAKAGVQNIETLECAAEELEETQASFDAAISRLGLMLFSSPRRALEAVQHVLKPGARFAALVFTTPANNPFVARPMAILLRHAGKPQPAPGSPGIFALGADGVLEKLMKDSGLLDVRIRTIRAPVNLPGVSDTLEMMQEAFGAYRAVVADLSDAGKRAAWSEVSECLKEFVTNGGLQTELEFIVGSGSKAL